MGTPGWIKRLDPTKKQKADDSAFKDQAAKSEEMRKEFMDSMRGEATDYDRLSGYYAYTPDQAKTERAAYAQIANADTAQSRGQMGDAVGLLRDAAYGNAPSAAQIQANQATSQGISQMYNMAAMASGNPAAFGNVSMTAANMQAQNAANNAALRAQEMQQARMAYLQGSDAFRAQDMTMASNQAQLNQGVNLANMQAGNSMNQFNVGAINDSRKFAQENLLRRDLANQGAGLQAAQITNDMKRAYIAAATGQSQAAMSAQASALAAEQGRLNQAGIGGLMGGLMGTAGQVLGGWAQSGFKTGGGGGGGQDGGTGQGAPAGDGGGQVVVGGEGNQGRTSGPYQDAGGYDAPRGDPDTMTALWGGQNSNPQQRNALVSSYYQPMMQRGAAQRNTTWA